MRVNIEQNTPAWHEWRKSLDFSASEAPALLGESQFFPHNIEELKAVKTGVLPPPFYSKAMQDGHKYEDRARELAAEHFDEPIIPACEEITIRGYKIGASLDGIMNPFDEKNIEIKVSDKPIDDLVAQYIPQLQFQMVATGIHASYLIAYRKDKDEIEVSDAVAADPEYKLRFTDAFAKYADAKPAEPKVTDIDDPDVINLAEEYRELSEQAAEIKAKQEEIKAQLITAADGKSIRAAGVTVYPINPRKTIQWSQYAKDHKITPPEEYIKVGNPSWGLTTNNKYVTIR